jgi:hypothetical protein
VKTKILLLIAVFILPLLSYGQKKFNSRQNYGIIIIDDENQIEGVIELNGDQLSPWDVQKKVIFYTTEQFIAGRIRKRDRLEFKPEEIMGFTFGERVFLSRGYSPSSLMNRNPKMELHFLELVVDGSLQIFLYYDNPGFTVIGMTENVDRRKEECRDNPLLLISKNGGNLEDVMSINIMDFISDVPEVVAKYHEGVYGFKPVGTEERRGLGRMVAQKADQHLLREQIMPIAADYNSHFIDFPEGD